MSFIFIVQLIVAVFIIRFHANQYRLGGNAIIETINKATFPITAIFHPLFKGAKSDYSAILAALIIALLASFLLLKSFPEFLIFAILQLILLTWINVLIYSLFVVVLGSWVVRNPQQPVMQIAYSCTEWFMRPLQRIIPPLGGLDFTPILAFLVLNMAHYFVIVQLVRIFGE